MGFLTKCIISIYVNYLCLCEELTGIISVKKRQTENSIRTLNEYYTVGNYLVSFYKKKKSESNTLNGIKIKADASN